VDFLAVKGAALAGLLYLTATVLAALSRRWRPPGLYHVVEIAAGVASLVLALVLLALTFEAGQF
jgi:hypothetical protein